MENFQKKRTSVSSGSTEYSMELGKVNDLDPNHIHFVSVGRVKDQKILISAVTNRQYQRSQEKFLDMANSMLPKTSYTDQMSNKTKTLFKLEGQSLAHQTYMDKNFIVFAAITSDHYPEPLAQKFLSHLAENLYEADPYDFKKDP